jgi:PAS domain-containing protein
MGIPDLKKLVHSPEGFDAFGRSLLKALKRRGFLGFFCFSEFEQEIFVHPAVSPDVAQQALEFLMQSEWRDDPVEAFPQVFRRLGFSLEDSKRVVQSSFLMSGASEKPLGAYAVLEDSTAAASGPAPDYQSVDALLTELVRSRMAIQKYRDAARDTEATADIVRRVGSILHNSTQRQQVLAGILDLAMAVARADVGAMLAVDDGELRPEVELGLALGQIEGLRFYPEDESILDRVSRSGQPLVIDDVSAAAFRAAAALPPQVRGLIAVPLFLESELKGLICLAGGASGRELSAGSLEPLESVSAFMALAFENAVLRANRGGGERGVPRRPADFDAMLLDLLFGVESDGVALGDDLGRVVYLNPAAQKLLGVDPLATRAASKPVEVDGEAPESWLRSQWLECKPGEAMKAAVRTSAGVGIDCTLRRLESRGPSGRRCAGYWARLQSQEKAGDVGLRGASAVAEELRESLSKVKLGVRRSLRGSTLRRPRPRRRLGSRASPASSRPRSRTWCGPARTSSSRISMRPSPAAASARWERS